MRAFWPRSVNCIPEVILTSDLQGQDESREMFDVVGEGNSFNTGKCLIKRYLTCLSRIRRYIQKY